jgi:hypothetical protein
MKLVISGPTALFLAAILFPQTAVGTLVSFGSGANQFTMEFVTILDPGNAADTTGSPNPAGAVSYGYRIGKYEVSEDMIDKANTLGSLGITKDTRTPIKPATSVSWNEAARFVNWLNTSSGFQPAYKFTTQPGDMGYNADENISLWAPGDPGFNAANPFRNSQAHYFLPSADEWYKAAYYDPAAGVYYDFPTSSDSTPDGIDFVGDPTFDAVFYDGGSNPQPNDVTDVGVLSPYGTAGQGANVYEWQETASDLVNDSGIDFRVVRGGYWNNESSDLLSWRRNADHPGTELFHIGFRVATVPEPSAMLYGAVVLLGAMCWTLVRR